MSWRGVLSWVIKGCKTANKGQKLTRRGVEREFGVDERTAKRELGELSEAGMIEFDRREYQGYYRLT